MSPDRPTAYLVVVTRTRGENYTLSFFDASTVTPEHLDRPEAHRVHARSIRLSPEVTTTLGARRDALKRAARGIAIALGGPQAALSGVVHDYLAPTTTTTTTTPNPPKETKP